jgi:co-chaperonin GroES (HSP10)
MEYNVVVEMDPTEEVTRGGIILPSSKTDRDKLATEEGVLVALSPHAFTYEAWPEGETPPQAGDRVLIARYAGAIHERGGKTFRILKDKDIVAVVEPSQALAAVA